jgi:SAM-dependent methyltransferase
MRVDDLRRRPGRRARPRPRGRPVRAHARPRPGQRGRRRTRERRVRAAGAQVHPFGKSSFDAVISRFGIMFFADPVAAFANLRRATRPGGSFWLLGWQYVPANVSDQNAAAPRPALGLHRAGSGVTGSGRLLLRAQTIVTSMYPMATLIAIL